MITRVATAVFLALCTSGLAQNLPSERPANCNGSNCNGCTPFQPPEGSYKSNPCGIDDVYFPVPVYAVRNDMSAAREIESRQWVCFACCSLGCGFDEPENTCEYTNYQWKEGAKYGCSKCAGKYVSAKGGEVKTSIADLSTESVYTTQVTPYGACVPSASVPPASPSPPTSPIPSPPTSPIPSPSPSPTPSPPVAATPPTTTVSPTVTATPPATPTTVTAPAPSTPVTVPSVQVAPLPAPEVVEVPAPAPFVPVTIGSTTSGARMIARTTGLTGIAGLAAGLLYLL